MMQSEPEILEMLRVLRAEQRETELYYQEKSSKADVTEMVAIQTRYSEAIARIEAKQMALEWVLGLRDALA